MTDKLRAAAKAALSAMSVVRVFVTSKEKIKHPEGTDWYDNIISNLEAALAESAIKESLTVAEQEPVAWMSDSDVGFYKEEFGNYFCVPLYTAPPRMEWVGLTEDEIKEIANNCRWSETYHVDFSRAIETKLREKNS